MKGRRGKSDASDSESENNGVDAGVARDQENDAKSDHSDDQMPLSKRSAGAANNTSSRKRNSRASRGKTNYNDDENHEEEPERENGKASSSKKKKIEKNAEPESDEEYEVWGCFFATKIPENWFSFNFYLIERNFWIQDGFDWLKMLIKNVEHNFQS